MEHTDIHRSSEPVAEAGLGGFGSSLEAAPLGVAGSGGVTVPEEELREGVLLLSIIISVIALRS